MIFNRIAAAAILSAIALQEISAVRISRSRPASPTPDYPTDEDYLNNEKRKAEKKAEENKFFKQGVTGTIARRGNVHDELKATLAQRDNVEPIEKSTIDEETKKRLNEDLRLGGVLGRQAYKDGVRDVNIAKRIRSPGNSPQTKKKAPAAPPNSIAYETTSIDGLQGVSEDEVDAARENLRSHLLRPRNTDKSNIPKRRSTGHMPVEIGKSIDQLIKEAKDVDMDLAEYWLTHKGAPSEDAIKEAQRKKHRKKIDEIKQQSKSVSGAIRKLNAQAEANGYPDLKSYYFSTAA